MHDNTNMRICTNMLGTLKSINTSTNNHMFPKHEHNLQNNYRGTLHDVAQNVRRCALHQLHRRGLVSRGTKTGAWLEARGVTFRTSVLC